jgi:phage terminase small subunit
MSDKELTQKQKLFCEYYIENWNATDAAKRAGYSETTAYSIGSENLSKPEIKEYIEEIQKDIAKLAGISRLSIVKDLINIKDHAEQEKDQIKAIEVVNKMLGMNEPEKQEIVSHEIVAKKPDWMKEDI